MTRDSVTHLETPSLRNTLNAEREMNQLQVRECIPGETMLPRS